MEYKDIFSSDRDLSFFPADTDAPLRLTIARIDAYNRLGYLFPLPVLNDDELAFHRRLFESMLETHSPDDGFAINGYFRTYGGAYDLVNHPLLLDYAQDLLGEDLICHGAHYICKLPHNDKVLTWHQDGTLWPFTPSRSVTLWVALDDSDVDNGCMKVLPGSHLLGGVEHVDSHVDPTDVNGNKIADELISCEAVDVELKAGEASAHSDLLIHGSRPNESDRRRCGVAVSYVPSDVRDIGLGWNKAVVVCRGSDSSGHWKHIPRPEPLGPAGLE